MEQLVVAIKARLYGVPVEYIGDDATIAAHTTVFFTEAVNFLIAYLPRSEGTNPYLWASWSAQEQTLLTYMTSYAFFERLANVTIPAAASAASSITEVEVAPTYLSKGKADEVEATFATANMTQKQSAGTIVMNVAKMLESLLKTTGDKIVSLGLVYGLDLNQYVGRPFFDLLRVPPLKL